MGKEYHTFKASNMNKSLCTMLNDLTANGWELVKVFDDKNTVLMVRELKQKRNVKKVELGVK